MPTNKSGSLRGLQQLLKNLERTNTNDQYDAIIQEQVEQGIVDQAPAKAKGREYYIPHKAVVRENAETTKSGLSMTPRLEKGLTSHPLTTVCIRDHPYRICCGACPGSTLYFWLETCRKPFYKYVLERKKEMP